jgi:hypothetical protein
MDTGLDNNTISQSSQAPALAAIEEAEGFDTVRDQLGPMRLLVAQFAASQLEILRTGKNYEKLIADGGAIVTDIMSFLQPAPSL